MWIIKYIVVSIIAILFGQVVGHLNKKMPPVVSEEITYKEFFKSLKSDFKIDILNSIILIVLCILTVYFKGINAHSVIYMLAYPMLLIVFSIDYRFQLIPDEAHIYFGVLGLASLFTDLSNWYSYLLGAVVGGGIFLLIAGFAILILKKEGMGFGDVKLMGALGFLFGLKNILAITLVSFFIGAIVGALLIVIKKKDGAGYIPFGPFIVIGAVILIFVGADTIFDVYVGMCMGLSTAVTDLIYNITH